MTMCPNREGCPLYPEFKSTNILRIFQVSYCDTSAAWKRCERYQMKERGERPPPRLLPTGEMLDDHEG